MLPRLTRLGARVVAIVLLIAAADGLAKGRLEGVLDIAAAGLLLAGDALATRRPNAAPLTAGLGGSGLDADHVHESDGDLPTELLDDDNYVEILATDWPRLRSVLDQAIDEIYVVDPATGRILDVSVGAAERSGVPAARLVGAQIEHLFTHEDDERIRRLLESAADATVARATFDTHRVGIAGSGPVRVRIIRLDDDPPLVLLLATDRTEVEAAEQALSAAQARMRTQSAERTDLEANVAAARDQVVRLLTDRERMVMASRAAVSLRDRAVRRLAELEVDHCRLVEAIDQVNDLISVVGEDGLVRYANRAWQAATGFDRARAVGTPVSDRRADLGGTTAGLWSAIDRGEAWTGALVTRCADGGYLHTRGQLSTIVQPDGAPGELVLTERIVRDGPAADAEATLGARVATARALARLRPGGTVAATAHAICSEIVRLDDVGVAAFIEFGEAAGGGLLGLEPSDVFGAASGYRLSPEFRLGLAERVRDGAFTMPADPHAEATPLDWALRAGGIVQFSFAPILDGEKPVALLGIGTAEEDADAVLRDLMPALIEFAAMAGALIGADLGERDRAATERASIVEIIERRAVQIDFSPIVDLATNLTRGFEAVTRFADGAGRERFAVAARHGLADRLQLVALDATATAAADLPWDLWILTKVSPDFVLDYRDTIPAIVARLQHDVVLELGGPTTHSFAEIRAASAGFGPRVRLAVDDRAAGTSRAGDVVDLRPDVVQVSAELVRGIDVDPVRQALARGHAEIARACGGVAFARGVTTEGEQRELLRLGIGLGIGPLFEVATGSWAA